MKKDIIGIIGLGYVGLPLALAISKKKFVVGFDKNIERIKELKKGKFKNFTRGSLEIFFWTRYSYCRNSYLSTKEKNVR